MKSQLCEKRGIELPLFAFSHCRDVVAAVTNAGGFGALGAVAHSAYYVGQTVGPMNTEQFARSVVEDFMQDYVDALERLTALLDD